METKKANPMSQLITIGHTITFPTLRDYIITHRIDSGDSIVVNPHDYEGLVHEVKHSPDGMAGMPIKVMGVLVTQDTTDTIPVGKMQVVKNEAF